jgi:hypothetical protein
MLAFVVALFVQEVPLRATPAPRSWLNLIR